MEDRVTVHTTFERELDAGPLKEGNSFKTGSYKLSNGTVVSGNMPIAAAFTDFKFVYKQTMTHDARGRTVHELAAFPEVNIARLKMEWRFFTKFSRRFAEQVKDWRKLFINPYALENPKDAPAAVKAFDEVNGTDLYDKFLLAFNEVDGICMRQKDFGFKQYQALLLLHYGVWAQRVFGISRKDIEGITLSPLVKMVRDVIRNPDSGFRGVVFKKPSRRATDQTFEHIGTPDGGHRAETDTDQYVRCYLTLDRAIAIAGADPTVIDDVEMEDADDIKANAASRAAEILALINGTASGGDDEEVPEPPSKKRKVTDSGPINVPIGDTKWAWLSSDPRRTRIPLPDMNGLDASVWIIQALKEKILKEVSFEHHTHVGHDHLYELAQELRDRADFPVKHVPVERVYECLSAAVKAGELVAADPDKLEWWASTLGSAAKCPDGPALRAIPNLMVARTHVFRKELGVARFVGGLFKPNQIERENTRARNQIILDTRENDFFPDGIALQGAQLAAFRTAVTRPMTVIYGPSGVGKSTVLRAIVRFLVAAGNIRKIFFVAFKNDTVAKMMKDYEDVAPPTYFRTMRGLKVTETAAYVGTDPKTPFPHFVYTTCDMLRQKFKAGANLEASVLISDEAAVQGMEMFSDVLATLDLQKVRHAIWVGDNRQLDPILYGCPFKQLVEYPFAIELTRDFRSESATLRENLTKIRALNPDITLDDTFRVTFLPYEPGSRSVYAHRFSPEYMELVARETMAAIARDVAELLESKTCASEAEAYANIRILSPYNDVCRFLCAHINARFFGAHIPSDLYSRTMSKDEKRSTFSRVSEHLTVGERVYVSCESIPEEKIFRGHISTIKFITDGPPNFAVEDTRAGLKEINRRFGLKNTAPKITRGACRRLHLQSGTDIQLRGNNHHEFVSSASAHTVYRAQGDQYLRVIFVLPPGRMANNPNIYTATGRARDKVTIIAPKAVLIEAITTPGKPSRSMLSPLLTTFVHPSALSKRKEKNHMY